MGIYQAYFPFVVSLFLVMLIIKNIESQANIIRLSLKYFLSALSGLVFYFIMNKIFLVITNTSLTSYQGVSNMTDVSFSSIISSVLESYRFFFKLPLASYLGMNNGKISNCAFLISIISIMIIALTVTVKSFMISLKKGILSCSLFLLLPLSINLVHVMVQHGEIHSLMVYATVFVLIVPLILAEKLRTNTDYNWHRHFNAFIACSSLALIFFYTYYANIAHMKIDFLNSQSIAYCTKLSARIESTSGYRAGMSVAYINEGEKQLFHPNTDNYSILTGLIPFGSSPTSSYSWKIYMARRCGFSPQTVDNTIANELSLLPEVQSMPSYPDDGSIRIINDILVVKF